ncbi:hypothetical protein HBA54_13690 [Pelagibius litoralis]|uniref:Uncharacterized protein n=1 Tax=Pelagibius litoralis TaxID=374515 RepID=A0A967EYA8_9PROT|nr:hypothetical protein [Pelagibius litoralis]NIA69649.1 hypothetical protein [Pelagibius litoralis]
MSRSPQTCRDRDQQELTKIKAAYRRTGENDTMVPSIQRPLSAKSALSRALFGVSLLASLLILPPAEAAERCSEEVAEHLEELPLAEGDVKSLRIIERTNISDDFGPEIFGVDAWVRLNSCSGYLVINMTKGCFVRQTYTRGDCRVEGLRNY